VCAVVVVVVSDRILCTTTTVALEWGNGGCLGYDSWLLKGVGLFNIRSWFLLSGS
jgi:hypothetical protein